LIESEADLRALRRFCTNGRFLVEANDMAAVQLLQGGPFVAGATLNIYNERSLRILAERGLRRWVMPLELSGATLKQLQAGRPAGIETEVFGFGRLPLATSARCFTARRHNATKEQCEGRCQDDPDGLLVRAQDGPELLVINGVQVQSAHTFNALPMLGELIAAGVELLRISPQFHDTFEVVRVFDLCRRGEMEPDAGRHILESLMPVGPCDGYWWGEAGHVDWPANAIG